MENNKPTNPYRHYVISNGDTDFIIGVDRFEDLSINEAPLIKDWYYFQNSKKTVVKRLCFHNGSNIIQLNII